MSTVAVRSDNLHGMYVLEACVLCPRLDGLAGDLLCLLAVRCRLRAQLFDLVVHLLKRGHMFRMVSLQLAADALRSSDLLSEGLGSPELLLQGVPSCAFLLQFVAIVAPAKCEL